MAEPDWQAAPKTGLWRVARGPSPLAVRELGTSLVASTTGNRFDDPEGRYGVLYFGSSLTVCFGETLARLRPHPSMVALIGDDWPWRRWPGPWA